MKALVYSVDNKVVDVAQTAFDAEKSYTWFDCDDSVKIGHFYINGVFKENNLSDEEILIQVKEQKIAELKEIRDWKVGEPTPKNGSSMSYIINGVSVAFKVSIEDIGFIETIINLLKERELLGEINPTRGWDALNGDRYELNRSDFSRLKYHILDRDNTERYLYKLRKKEIKEIIENFSTLDAIERIKNFDINKVYEI